MIAQPDRVIALTVGCDRLRQDLVRRDADSVTEKAATSSSSLRIREHAVRQGRPRAPQRPCPRRSAAAVDAEGWLPAPMPATGDLQEAVKMKVDDGSAQRSSSQFLRGRVAVAG